MIQAVEESPQTAAFAFLKMSLIDRSCAPAFLRIVVRGYLAEVTKFDYAALDSLPDMIPWGTQNGEINARVKVLHSALEGFRKKWSNNYLDAFESSDQVRERLESYVPLCDWSQPNFDVKEEDEARWKQVAVSPQLRKLAISGRRLYDQVFGENVGLKAWLDGLPPGSRLSIYWKREDRQTLSIPWPLLYLGGEPEPGEELDPSQFFGLRFRLEYLESWSVRSLGLGSPERSYRGHVFFWKGPTKADYAEALSQFQSWSAFPNFYAVPDGWPPNSKDTEIKERAKALLRAERPSPMTVLYLYCQCSFKDDSPELYFGDPVIPDVTICEDDLPGTGSRYHSEPLVFFNACCTSAPVGIGTANLLESNFLKRGCRAYLGTVNRVPTRVASRFALSFFHFFLPRTDATALSAGESVSQSRMFLWTRYKNIGGLYYNFINNYEIYMKDDTALSREVVRSSST